MTQNRDFFTPENVDAQVEQFSSRPPAESAPQEQSGALLAGERIEKEQDAPARLVRELQAYYQADYQQNRAFLARARRRIAAHQFVNNNDNQARTPMDSAPVLSLSQERTRKMQYPPSTERSAGRKLSRGLSLMAAVLVAGLLVGTLAVVLTLSRGQQGSQGIGGKKATPTSVPTPTPTPVAAGTVVYTKKSPAGANFGAAAWSPDGTRMAAAGTDQNTGKTKLYIWDAASGKNLLTVPLSMDDLGDVQWSPTGKYLSLDNLQAIAIVDSQTGALVKTINYHAPAAFNASGASQAQLSSNAPLGGGFGFYSVAWTPDGASLGVAVSNITSGNVVLLDPRTGAVKKTFSEQTAPIGLAMAFSSDGQYMAVSYSNDAKIVVWSVATRHVVFTLSKVQSMIIGWQPGTHNLARSVSGTVQLWDVNSKKLLITYKGGSDFAWSPDGKKLAIYLSFFDKNPFTPTTNTKVTILSAASGATVGSYTSKSNGVYAISWSPDGRFIATGESTNNSSQIVVWAA